MRFPFSLRNTHTVAARIIPHRILLAHHIGDIVDGAHHIGQVGHGGLHVVGGKGVVASNAKDQEKQYYFGKEFYSYNTLNCCNKKKI